MAAPPVPPPCPPRAPPVPRNVMHAQSPLIGVHKVAGFIGTMNFLDVRVIGSGNNTVTLAADGPGAVRAPVETAGLAPTSTTTSTSTPTSAPTSARTARRTSRNSRNRFSKLPPGSSVRRLTPGLRSWTSS